MQTLSHNRRLSKMIDQAAAQADSARTQDDLLGAVDVVRAFDAPLTFELGRPKAILASGLFMLALALLLWFDPVRGTHAWLRTATGADPALICLILGGAGLALAIGSLWFMGAKKGRLPGLSNSIAEKSSLLVAGLEPMEASAEQVLQALGAEFGDYARGNHRRDIEQSLRAAHAGPLHRLDYRYHHLHYVNKRTVTTTESDGKGGTRTVTKTVYDHYHRYSLVVAFPWVTGVSLRSDGQSEIDRAVRHDTASSDFNGVFDLSGDTQMLCARFAKPSTVLLLLELEKRLDALNLEFSRQGHLCLSFNNDDLLAYRTASNLLEPDRFREEIAAGVRLPALEAILAIVHRLAEQHDDNFSLPPQPSLNMES